MPRAVVRGLQARSAASVIHRARFSHRRFPDVVHRAHPALAPHGRPLVSAAAGEEIVAITEERAHRTASASRRRDLAALGNGGHRGRRRFGNWRTRLDRSGNGSAGRLVCGPAACADGPGRDQQRDGERRAQPSECQSDGQVRCRLPQHVRRTSHLTRPEFEQGDRDLVDHRRGDQEGERDAQRDAGLDEDALRGGKRLVPLGVQRARMAELHVVAPLGAEVEEDLVEALRLGLESVRGQERVQVKKKA